MNEDVEKLYFTLEKQLKTYLPSEELPLVRTAFEVARDAHSGQKRKSENPYIIHPVHVALILAQLKQGSATVIAGLLHDTVEDTPLVTKDIKTKFGEDICQLVEGVTKLGKIRFDSKESEQAENYRKMFLAMANDVRVVIIKLADRLHNMRTISFLPKEKQARIAQETRDVFAPLAHRMGMWNLKWELEDLVFQTLNKEEFMKIKTLIASHRQVRERYVERFIGQIHLILEESRIKAQIKGRPKHFYSIYQKLQKRDIAFEELYDVLGIRVLVETLAECYQVLGIVHSHFKPISGRIKDYIALPKSNMYQSLHTTVIGPEGKPIEIQIRTYQMHQVAEYGVAAHWQYKDRPKSIVKADFSWLKEIIDFHYDPNTPAAFLKELKFDLFIDEVFIFTPQGDIQVLQKGATPVDFAYQIHTEIGHACRGAKVNGSIVTLDYPLRNGDRVEIMVSKSPRPKLDWLDFVKTTQAKNRIKGWFRKQQSEENLKIGKRKLEKAIMMAGLNEKIPIVLSDELIQSLQIIYPQFALKTIDDLYRLIAHGDLTARGVVRKLREAISGKAETEFQIIEHKNANHLKKPKRGQDNSIKILGEDNIRFRFAKCCHPVPGDEIIGFITLGEGVSVHRRDCSQIFHLSEEKKNRLIKVEWNTSDSTEKRFAISVQITGFNRIDMLQDVLAKIAEYHSKLSHIDSRIVEHGSILTINLELEVRSSTEVNKLTQAFQQIPDVTNVQRL